MNNSEKKSAVKITKYDRTEKSPLAVRLGSHLFVQRSPAESAALFHSLAKHLDTKKQSL